MANRDYQYETSPRKVAPEYEPVRKKSKARKEPVQKKTSANKKKPDSSAKKKNSQKAKQKNKTKFRTLAVLNLFMLVVLVFAVMYRNSLISQSFAQIQSLKSKVTDIQKENDQIEISIQNSLNSSSIEQAAKDQLGMQKLTSKQTVYLDLPKKDYIEPSTEEVIIEQNQNIFEKIWNFITDLF